MTISAQGGGGTQGDGRFLIDKKSTGIISQGVLTGGNITGVHPQATFSGSAFAVSTFFSTAAVIPVQSNNVAPGTVTVAIATTALPAGVLFQHGGGPQRERDSMSCGPVAIDGTPEL